MREIYLQNSSGTDWFQKVLGGSGWPVQTNEFNGGGIVGKILLYDDGGNYPNMLYLDNNPYQKFQDNSPNGWWYHATGNSSVCYSEVPMTIALGLMWSFHWEAEEGAVCNLVDGPAEGDVSNIPAGETYELAWGSQGGGKEVALYNNGALVLKGRGGTHVVREGDGPFLVKTLEGAKRPTHFQVRWFFNKAVDINGVPGVYEARGTIEPFEAGSVSTTAGQSIATVDGQADNCGIWYFWADEKTPAGWQGRLSWSVDPFEDHTETSMGQTGSVASEERFSTAHRVLSELTSHRIVYPLTVNDPGSGTVFNFKILEIEDLLPPDTVEPQPEEPIGGGGGGGGGTGGGGGGITWPEPVDEIHPPPEPEGGPGPTPPGEEGGRPEPSTGCVCSEFYLYIGDWIQNVSINIWNLCQYVFQITGVLQAGFVSLVLTLQICGDKLGQLLAYLYDMVYALGTIATKIGELGEKLDGIKDAVNRLGDIIESKPPIDVIVQDDEVLVQGTEREEDVPEAYFRRGVK